MLKKRSCFTSIKEEEEIDMGENINSLAEAIIILIHKLWIVSYVIYWNYSHISPKLRL